MRSIALLLIPFLVFAGCTRLPPPATGIAPPAAGTDVRGRPLPDELCPPPPATPAPARQPGLPSTPPPPVPPPPPDATAYLKGPEPVLTTTGDPRVDAYLKRVLWEGGSGWRPFLLRAFAPVRANAAVLEEERAMRRPADWIAAYVTPDRVSRGRALYRELNASAAPGAPLEVRLAMWGILSDYGARPPRFDMIEALANLGACGRGPGWADFAIYHAVRVLAESPLPRDRLRAYGTGRIGQLHFFPDQYERFAQDGDGDGIADVWTSRADILATLRLPAWEQGQPLAIEVERPSWNAADPREGRMLRALHSGQGVAATMLKRPGGAPWPAEARGWYGRFVEPFGPRGPAFLLSRNFMPVSSFDPARGRWESTDADPGFGLAVHYLAEAIAGRPGPARPQ